MTSAGIEQSQINGSADFWRYFIGVNVIPANTKNKTTAIRWSEYQDKPIPEWQYEQWKKEGDLNKGIAIIGLSRSISFVALQSTSKGCLDYLVLIVAQTLNCRGVLQ
jgi:hypothetical protein